MGSNAHSEDVSGFHLQNLPYGVFSTTENPDHRIGVAINTYILDLSFLVASGHLSGLDFDESTLKETTLNRYASQGRPVHRRVRARLQDLLVDILAQGDTNPPGGLYRQDEAEMHLPFSIGDYTDFFTSRDHAQRCTNIFRPGQELGNNFFTMPIAYHGRSSSIVVSGSPVYRPQGQYLQDGVLTFGPSLKLDFELEFAAFVGRGNHRGSPIPVEKAEEHIFGYVLMNDWSARDIQQREAHPLGPFNGKNFCTTISPWVVTPDALEPFRVEIGGQGELPGYLTGDHGKAAFAYDIPIDIFLQPHNHDFEHQVLRCNTKNVLFSPAQMLAHHTAGGCPMRPGDLFATGTLSGPSLEEVGCLLEATWNGSRSLEIGQREGKDADQVISRTWLEDGDKVSFRVGSAIAVADEDQPRRISFGRCDGVILPMP